MADISALGSLMEAEPLDMETYPDLKDRPAFQLPKKGRYVVKAPEGFPSEAFGRTQAGYLSIQIDPTIVGPTNENFTLRYSKISAKAFKRNGITASQIGDYLRACGRRANVGGSAQELADAVEQTANLTYQVDLDWRVYEKGTGFTLEGMENFPSDGNGGYLSTIESPTQKDENGNPVRLRANVYITRFVPATA